MPSRVALVDRMNQSLFMVPAFIVGGAIALAAAMIVVDDQLTPATDDLPFLVASTVDSARAILGAVATGTITVAGIAFSITLLVMQMASSQYSPRVVHGMFRDQRNKRVMGLVIGTFTYCLIILQAVRGELGDDGNEVVPNLSVLMAVVLGVASVLAVIWFIHHNAHTMEVSEILQSVTDQTIEAVQSRWPEVDEAPAPLPLPDPGGEGFPVSFHDNGWVIHVDEDRLLGVLPPGGVVQVEFGIGRYAIGGAPLATVWPLPADPDHVRKQVHRSITLGRTRSLPEDPAYGVRQLADVAIRALSTGVDDPTTAQDAIFHLAAVLREMHRRVPPAEVVVDDQNRHVVRRGSPGHRELIRLAFQEIRRSAARQPTVCVYLLEALHLLGRPVDPPAPDEALDEMHEQARLVVAGALAADLLDDDADRVRRAFEERFGPYRPPAGSRSANRDHS